MDTHLAHLCRFTVRSPNISLEVFLGSVGQPLRPKEDSRSHLGVTIQRICLSDPPTCFNLHLQSQAGLPFCVTPSSTILSGTGILTCFPSTTPFGLALGADSPWRIALASGNLGLSANGVLIRFVATRAGISLFCMPSSGPHGPPSSHTERSPTNLSNSTASVHGLAPVNCRRRVARPVSYYAFFKGWLLLSQPPGCLCNPTSFST
jgi:hypothetical protein